MANPVYDGGMTEKNKDALRRKKLIYRCVHRGTKEADLIIGKFAVMAVPAMSDEEMRQMEIILEQADSDLFHWLTKQTDVPADMRFPVLLKLIATANV